MASAALPATQYAVQLVGPGQLKLNTAKDVSTARARTRSWPGSSAWASASPT